MKDKLETLELRVNELIKLFEQLQQENKTLKVQRDALEQKTSSVQDKVKSMIDEIRALEGQV